MGKKDESKRFAEKFKELTPENQRYIVGIQQALIFAQTSKEKQGPAPNSDILCAENAGGSLT